MNRINRINSVIRSSLFISSYTPLFIIIIIREFYKNKEYLNWVGMNKNSIICFLKCFSLPTCLTITIILGIIINLIFFHKMKNNTRENGIKVNIKKIENKNSESISYIATYIVPFLFQNLSNIVDIISISIIFLVIWRIYINSTLIVVNPVVNLFYSLYQIEYEEESSKKIKNSIIICKEKYLTENDKLLIKDFGHKLNFGIFLREE